MQALVYQGPGKKSLEDRPKPILQLPSDAVVRITRTTICGIDLHILKGDVATCKAGTIWAMKAWASSIQWARASSVSNPATGC